MLTQTFTTTSPTQTQKIAAMLAGELGGGEIICLSGDLGAGKTTFTQGLLKALDVKGPYTSPTFAIMKQYEIRDTRRKIRDIYHIDAYRIQAKDMLELGFTDFTGKENTLTIIEWPENLENILPKDAVWIGFKWIDENRREIKM